MVLSTLLNLMRLFSSLQVFFSWSYGPKRGLNLAVHCEAKLWAYQSLLRCQYLIAVAEKISKQKSWVDERFMRKVSQPVQLNIHPLVQVYMSTA